MSSHLNGASRASVNDSLSPAVGDMKRLLEARIAALELLVRYVHDFATLTVIECSYYKAKD